MTLYFLIKYLHVLGAIVILGTGTGIAFFMLMAHRAHNAEFIARPASELVVGDGPRAPRLALALCDRSSVLGRRRLHADRDARSRAQGRRTARRSSVAL